MSAAGYTGHMVKHDHELYPDWGKRYELFNYQPSSNMAEHSTAELLNSILVIISMLVQTSCMVYFYVF